MSIFFVQQNLFAQQLTPTGDTSRVQILNATTGEIIVFKNESAKKFKGKVVLRQKDATLYCDSAILDNAENVYARGHVVIKQTDTVSIFADSVIFHGFSRTADLFGDVILVNNDKKIFANKLNYDLNRKIATYNNKATLDNGRTQLTSKRGQYFVSTSQALFKDQVLVVDKDFDMKTDTLKFDAQKNIATFLAPTLIYLRDSAQFYTEEGFYDLQNDNAAFTKTPQYQKLNQLATADTMLYDGKTTVITLKGNAVTKDTVKEATANTIRYNRKTEESQLEGNAHFVDEKQNILSDTIVYHPKTKTYTTRGRSRIVNEAQILEADLVDFDSQDSIGIAKGNVFWQDTASKTSLRCEKMQYDQRREYIKAGGGRPILSSLMEKDTLWLRADTIITFKQKQSDTARSLIAYHKVRMYKSNFQSVCDSLFYSEQDSIFRLFKDPIVWSDTSQLSGDTMRIMLKNKKIDRVFLKNNAFIINSTDEAFFNQIKGREITAEFEGDDLRRMFVEGNAESVYYALDEKGGYVSVNKMICSRMLVLFGDNKVDGIKFYAQPKATMFPMKQANHDELKMKGFRWEKKLRPKNRLDL
ncbi:MAG: OstA-like protein [Saprospiraceae bacterium]|nr:OstA-like protein [Saprospiraceae bacterium]